MEKKIVLQFVDRQTAKACKFMDERRWDEAKAYLEALVAFVNICENEEKRQESSLK